MEGSISKFYLVPYIDIYQQQNRDSPHLWLNFFYSD